MDGLVLKKYVRKVRTIQEHESSSPGSLPTENHATCLQMFRRLAIAGADWDFDALTWISRHQDVAEEFMMKHCDFLTPSERIWIYTYLAGLFGRSFKRILEFRLQADRDPQCRETLLKVRERYSDPLKWPHKERSRADRLIESEEDLKSEIPIVRYAAAEEIYELTGKADKVVPALSAILHDRTIDDELRQAAAKFLAKISSLDQEAVQKLQAVANDPNDPVRAAAEKALKRQKGILKRAGSVLERTFLRKEMGSHR